MKTLSTPLQFSLKLSQVPAASPTHGSVQQALPYTRKVHLTMYAITGLFLLFSFYVKYLRTYFTDISTPTCMTTSACTNTALTTASHLSLIFWKQYMRSKCHFREWGSSLDLVYQDFQKAFNKVLHEQLLLKLKAPGITS